MLSLRLGSALVLMGRLAFALVLPQQEAETNCTVIHDIFRLKNISVDLPEQLVNGSGRCGEEKGCCSAEMEATLEATVARDLHSLLYHSFHSVHGMLITSESAISEEVRKTSRESENRTLSIFAEVYKGMWNEVQSPVHELYSSLSAYLDKARSIPTDLPPAVPTEDAATLKGYLHRFFKKLFPMVYQESVHSTKSNVSSLTEEYSDCLMKSFDDVKPFGGYPENLASQVARSFETTKVLLEALSLGIEVLNTTDHMMRTMPENTDSCREALLRLYYCPKCLGLPSRVKPCNGYCLNVMRGCLTQQRTTELDLPWSNFLVEVEKLVAQIGGHGEKIPSIDTVLYSFSGVISDAIMHASLNAPTLESQVKSRCGPPKLGPRTTPEPPPARLTVQKAWDTATPGPVLKQVRAFSTAVEASKARGFFANLAEALCSDDSFAETRDTADCWNGRRIGEYTKPLVRPGLDAQKYNPELKWMETAADPGIRHLSDKLRHMRQVVMSHMHMEKPALVSYSQVYAGSGSGGSDITDDEDAARGRSEGDWEGSASGDGIDTDGPIEDVSNRIDTPSGKDIARTKTSSTDSSSALDICLPLLLAAITTRWLL